MFDNIISSDVIFRSRLSFLQNIEAIFPQNIENTFLAHSDLLYFSGKYSLDIKMTLIEIYFIKNFEF